MFGTARRSKFEYWKMGLMLIAVGIVLAIAIPGVYYWSQENIFGKAPSVEINVEEGKEAITAQIQFYVVDMYAKQGIDGAKIYLDAGDSQEILTTDTSGYALTGNLYHSGDALKLKIVAPDNGVYFYTLSVPYVSEGDAQRLQKIPITVRIPSIGTYTLAVMKDLTSYGNGQTINVTSGEDISFVIQNTKLNSGYLTTTNPYTGETLGAYLVIKVPSDANIAFSIAGATVITRGSYTYYVVPINDDDLAYYEKTGTSEKVGGIATIPATVTHSLTDGVSVVIELHLFANLEEFQNTGGWGDFDMTVATATITFGP